MNRKIVRTNKTDQLHARIRRNHEENEVLRQKTFITSQKKLQRTSGTMDLKSSINDDHPHRQAERLIFDVLQQLQTMYNNAVKTFSLTVIIKKIAFETIENELQ